MLNHTYTSVKNANLVDCGKKTHIASQPSPLLKDNFLGEFRTELDKKKVLANLGIATELSLEWEYIKGDIGRSEALMQELDSRTKYISAIDGFQKSLIDGIKYLESVVGGEQEGEEEQNNRLDQLETLTEKLVSNLEELKDYLTNTLNVDVNKLKEDLSTITEKVNNITNLIQVSSKAGNALHLVGEDELAEGETPGLYVKDLEQPVNTLRTDVDNIMESYVTKDELGGGDFNFVNQDSFDSYTTQTDAKLSNILSELDKTVKTGEDGHVDTLYVNKISKNNNDDNIKISDSFEVENGIPLDVRFVVPTRADLAKLNVEVCYAGMGVIVKDESALYILREPFEGKLTQEFIEDLDVSWKCPEDLVTQALTRAEYEELLVVDPVTGKNNINPSKFYYVYEEDTTEPNRSDFTSDESYQEAYNAWLKILSQEYMSAAWGVDIENKVAEKASNADVFQLHKEIQDIQGGENSVSLKTLNSAIEDLKTTDEVIKNSLNNILIITDDEESGRLVEAENAIEEVRNSLDGYVSKEYIQDTSNNFIFVKNDVYLQDKIDLENSLKTQIISDEVKSNKIVLNETTLIVDDNKLKVDGQSLATSNEIPKMVVLTLEEYDSLELKNAETYYYTINDDEIYVTKTTLDSIVLTLRDQINSLHEQIILLELRIPGQE